MSRLNWTEEEHLLALDLYFQHPEAVGRADHPEVIELSRVLNALPIHPVSQRNAKFRNPNGVGLKLANFRASDPREDREGMARGAQEKQRSLIEKYLNDHRTLRAKAAELRAWAEEAAVDSIDEQYEEAEAAEGRYRTRLHRYRERSGRLPKQKKKQRLATTGTLECEACGFDFVAVYGELGRGFAECHHLTPIAELETGSVTSLEDLAILCSNCHRMIHRNGGLTMDELSSRMVR